MVKSTPKHIPSFVVLSASYLVLLSLILNLTWKPAYADTEVQCRQILQNYARLASSDSTLPALFNPGLDLKPDDRNQDAFETELAEASNGADVNMTCYRDGTLLGFDIRFIDEVTLPTAKKFFAAILASSPHIQL